MAQDPFRWLDPDMEVVGLSFPARSKWRQAGGLGAPHGGGFHGWTRRGRKGRARRGGGRWATLAGRLGHGGRRGGAALGPAGRVHKVASAAARALP